MTYELISRFPIGSGFLVDDAQLSALHARAFGADPVVQPWARRLERHALTWIGAFEAGVLIGFVQVCWDGGGHAFLLDTAVEPSHQGRGIGAALVEAATTEARAAGCEWLHVDFEPHLAHFYLDSCGFRPTTAGLIALAAPPVRPTVVR
ncbi:GNAT family N-acetyltransferase [Actinoplanes sp. CA-131856]